MESPPPLPAPVKSSLSVGKIFLFIFAAFGALSVLALIGMFALADMQDSPATPTVRGSDAVAEPRVGVTSWSDVARSSSGFTPADIEARCRISGLEYYALARDGRLEGRATEAQLEQMEARGIKIYRAKIRKNTDVVFVISIIQAPRAFTPAEANEVLGILSPSTPVAVYGRFIYCNAGRPDPRGRGDEVIWMTPEALFGSL